MNTGQVKIMVESFVPSGGVDYETAPLSLKPGACIDALNFEVDAQGGYSRIGGYDRWDGTTCAEWMDVRTVTIAAIADTPLTPRLRVTGVRSGATMTLRRRAQAFDGEYINVLPAGSFDDWYVSDVKGMFLAGEDAQPVGAAQITLRIINVPFAETKPTAKEQAAYEADLRNAVRKSMEHPGESLLSRMLGSGIGPMLGVVQFNGQTYAFRESDIYPGLISIFAPANYDDPAALPARQWSERAVMTNHSPIGARMEFVEYNFLGNVANRRVFGVSGTGKAFEFFGTGIVNEITTPDPVDKPNHICVHLDRLVLAMDQEVVISEPGNPYGYDVTKYAINKICGSKVLGVLSLRGSDNSPALLIATELSMIVMYGDLTPTGDILNPINAKFVDFGAGTGITEWSLQNITQPIFGTDFGMSALSTSANFGGFDMSSISRAVKRFYNARRNRVTASVVCRSKNQYRIFFDDGYALYVTFEGTTIKGIMPINLRKVVACANSSIGPDGKELVLIGTRDGGLYAMDTGRSFDGAPIHSFVVMAYNHFKSPRSKKQFRRTTLEIDGDGYIEFDAAGQIDYASPVVAPIEIEDVNTDDYTDPSGWDRMTWDEFYFDAAHRSPIVIDTAGKGACLAVMLQNNSNRVLPFRLTGVMIQYNHLRGLR